MPSLPPSPPSAASPADANSLLVSPKSSGDADSNGKVDLSDLSTVLNNFGSATPAWTSGNFDNQSTIDLTDLSDVLNNFGAINPNANAAPTATGSGSIGVPEPASLALLLPAACLAHSCRLFPVSPLSLTPQDYSIFRKPTAVTT